MFSLIRSSSGNSLCSLLKLQFKTLSDLLRYINRLAPDLDIYSLAHHLCKMRIFYEPRSVTLGNNTTFCGGINEDGDRNSKK